MGVQLSPLACKQTNKHEVRCKLKPYNIHIKQEDQNIRNPTKSVLYIFRPLPLSACSPLCTPPPRPRLMPMLTMAPTAMALPTTGTAMVLPTMDMAMATTAMPAMPTPMVTMDTTARGPLIPRPLLLLRLMLMLTMAPMAMAWPTTDTAMDMDSLTTAMPTMDTVMP